MSNNCWVISDGSAGMENQARGLAEALGYEPILKRISLRPFWNFFSPHIRFGKQFCLSPTSDKLNPPWPELLIASGRRSILPALYIKEASKNHTKVVYLQNPKISPKYFDAVVCPKHDNLKGPNVISMVGAPHRVTKECLQQNYQLFSSIFSKYPGPRYSILIGGPNRVFQMTTQVGQTLVKQLNHLQKKDNASLLISTSRRTPIEILTMLKEAFSHNPRVYIWDFQGENPYFALLAWADAILLTCDSVNMISEVCSTIKPVYLIPLPGGSKKFSSFYEQLLEIDRIRWFKGNIDLFKAKSFNETCIITEKLKSLLRY